MVGLGNKQPVSASFCRRNIYSEREDELDAVERESRSDVESESEHSSGGSSVETVIIEKERKCNGNEALQALVSAASQDEESVYLDLNGRGSLDDVICASKESVMKIDEKIQILTPSAGNLPSSSSGVNQVTVSEEGNAHCNGKAENKHKDSIPEEEGSEDEGTLIPTVENWPTDNEVVERLLAVNESPYLEGYVRELVNVCGYETDSWGGAVEVGNKDFYPTESSHPLGEDEYKNFLESDDDKSGSGPQEFVTCIETQSESTSANTTLTSQMDELPHDEDVPKFTNQPESMPSKLAIVDHVENLPEIITNGIKVVDDEETPPGSEPKEVLIKDPEDSRPESIPTELAKEDLEENSLESIPTVLPKEDMEENSLESIPTVLPKEDLEENPPENISTELSAENLEKNLYDDISTELFEEKLHENTSTELSEENLPKSILTELAKEDLEENLPVKDSCSPTNSMQHEASSDALSTAEFSKLVEITDDFILDVFINDVEQDPLLDHDLKIEFGNGTELVSPPNEGVTDNSKLQEKEQTAEATSCLTLDTKIDTVQGHEDDSTSCTVSTNDEESGQKEVQDAQVMETEKDKTPAEKCLHDIDGSKESPMSSASRNRGSVRDPRLRRRTRSFEAEESASQVSVASTASSHSSVRPCSVILTRVDASPSQSPVRSTIKITPVKVASPSRKSNSINTEPDQSKREPELDGCVDENKKPLAVTPNSMSEKSNDEAAELTPQSVPRTNDTTTSVDEDVVNMEDEPIRLYEPINLDDPSDPVEDEAISNNKTEVNMDATPDVSSKPVRATRKRMSSAKFAEAEVKKGRPSSMKRESTETPEKALSSMSKREILAYVKKESKKAQPDFIKLSEAMSITYDPTRKAMYDNGQVDVEIIKKKHPELLHYQMVKDELGRILKDPMKMVRLEKELSEEVLSSALEGKKKTSFPSKKRHPLWLKTIKLWGENKGNEKSAEYQRVLGMLAVCFEFAENAVVNKLCTILKQNGTLAESDTEKMDTPTIVVKESEVFSVVEEADIWIYVDGEKYIKVPNMYEAVLSVFAAYYIFNITYDKSLKSLFEFFDYLCDNRQSTYKAAEKKWPPELRNGVKEFPLPVLDP